MARPLLPLETLESWSGLQAFYETFEARGFKAHTCYIELIRAAGTEPEWQANLMPYWEELAKETLSSGWASKFRGDNRHLPDFYRSPFLDRIETSVKPCMAWGTPVAIHPLVAAYEVEKSKALRGGASPEAPKYFDPQTRIKVAEYNRMGLSVTDWDGKAKAFALIFQEKAEAAGFERGKPAGLFGNHVNRLWFRLQGPNRRVFCIGYDSLGPLGIGRYLPFAFWIFPDNAPGEMAMLDLTNVIPGLRNYLLFDRVLYPMAYYNNMEEMAKCATIGIQAIVTAYTLLIDALSI